MSEPKKRTPVEENAYRDVVDLAASMERPFTTSDIEQYRDNGLDLQLAAEIFVERHNGSLKFMRSVQGYYNRTGRITQAQARAALNILREDVRPKEESEQAVEPEKHECLICHDRFDKFDDLDQHRALYHGGKERPETFTDVGEAEAVLEVNESKKGLDLRNLPDGRYAVPSGNMPGQTYAFLAVKRVKRTVHRDRRYQYGKIVTGSEIVVAGTIEVRLWSSDTKEWVGQQKPGDVYRGKFEEELEMVMMGPETFAILFGRLLGYCGRCGKKLTDDLSREIGLGLDCEKKRAEFSKPPKYTYIGTDRPDPEKANPLDEKYRTGELRRWVEPPTPPVETP